MIYDISRGRYDKCIIVGTGPSADPEQVDEFCTINRGALVITMKQAIELVPWCDYHVFNEGSLQEWDYSNCANRPIVVGCRSSFTHGDVHKDFNETQKDAELHVDTDAFVMSGGKFRKTMGNDLKVEDFLLCNYPDKLPHGTGLLNEFPLLLAIHSGATEVFLMGVTNYDLDAIGEDGKIGDIKGAHFWSGSRPIEENIDIDVKDMRSEQGATLKYFEYLRSIGRNMTIIGESYLSKKIPRLYL